MGQILIYIIISFKQNLPQLGTKSSARRDGLLNWISWLELATIAGAAFGGAVDNARLSGGPRRGAKSEFLI